jgi:hypothetical protein
VLEAIGCNDHADRLQSIRSRKRFGDGNGGAKILVQIGSDAWRGSTLELPHQEGSLALLMDPDGLWNGSSVHE